MRDRSRPASGHPVPVTCERSLDLRLFKGLGVSVALQRPQPSQIPQGDDGSGLPAEMDDLIWLVRSATRLRAHKRTVPQAIALSRLGAPLAEQGAHLIGVTKSRSTLVAGLTRGPRRSSKSAAAFPYRPEWAHLIAALEATLRLHRHEPGTLPAQARYLHQRTGGMIGSLTHLIRGAAIRAILGGHEPGRAGTGRASLTRPVLQVLRFFQVQYRQDGQLTEGGMGNVPAAQVEERIRSAFPEGAIERVQVLAHGDDPEVGPGQTAARVILSRAGRPEGPEADQEIVRTIRLGGPAPFVRLAGELPFLEWIEFRPHVPGGHGGYHPDVGPSMRFSPREQGLGLAEQAGPGEEQDQRTPVMTRLGPADLAAVDTLIAAGIGGSRAEILRWAVSRIREHPAYAQLQDRVREISQLKAQF